MGHARRVRVARRSNANSPGRHDGAEPGTARRRLLREAGSAVVVVALVVKLGSIDGDDRVNHCSVDLHLSRC